MMGKRVNLHIERVKMVSAILPFTKLANANQRFHEQARMDTYRSAHFAFFLLAGVSVTLSSSSFWLAVTGIHQLRRRV